MSVVVIVLGVIMQLLVSMTAVVIMVGTTTRVVRMVVVGRIIVATVRTGLMLVPLTLALQSMLRQIVTTTIVEVVASTSSSIAGVSMAATTFISLLLVVVLHVSGHMMGVLRLGVPLSLLPSLDVLLELAVITIFILLLLVLKHQLTGVDRVDARFQPQLLVGLCCRHSSESLDDWDHDVSIKGTVMTLSLSQWPFLPV